jgi:glutathione synthase/RimK-type ligase-like ATP-grasp enzyme
MGSPHPEFSGVAEALAERGVQADLVHLNEVEDADWSDVGLVNVRMCRGFHTDPRFVDRLERLHDMLQELPRGPVPLVNRLALLHDAADKSRYLRALAEHEGVELIPTRWLPRGTDLRVAELMDEAGWDDLVVKPTVSAGSWGTIRVSRSGRPTNASHFVLEPARSGTPPYEAELRRLLASRDLLAQRFLPAVLEEGELSLVFLGGRFSHAVRKTVASNGGWWAHERHGGVNYRVWPSPEEHVWGETIYRALERRYGPMLFGRIDGIRDETGSIRLLECELAIPRLLLPEGEAFGRYAEVIVGAMREPAAALAERHVRW